MSLQNKYNDLLELGKQFEAKDGYVEELDGLLKVGGTVQTQYQKDQMWDAIKAASGEDTPSDIEADIKVEITDYYTKHTVQKGESLSLISKHYFGDPMKYMEIFNANTDQLKDPNIIHPDQVLTIPFPSA